MECFSTLIAKIKLGFTRPFAGHNRPTYPQLVMSYSNNVCLGNWFEDRIQKNNPGPRVLCDYGYRIFDTGESKKNIPRTSSPDLVPRKLLLSL